MEIPQRVGLSGVSAIDPATVGAEIGPLHCQIDCQGTDKVAQDMPKTRLCCLGSILIIADVEECVCDQDHTALVMSEMG